LLVQGGDEQAGLWMDPIDIILEIFIIAWLGSMS
jgi:hypothetical protein